MMSAPYLRSVMAGVMSIVALPVLAATYPAPKEGDWVMPSFQFHTGETMQNMKLHYTTIGNPAGEPVLVLHGTAGSGGSMLTPAFAGELFGPGQPLDAAKYFIILPDAVGAGTSSRPSEGLGPKFPKYDYTDMVTAQYRLVVEGLGVKHLRLVMGNSMGGMQTWMWGTTYPDFMDALVPMASQPTEMSSRNWMLRRMLVESVKRDPAYNNGNYTSQPKALVTANVFFGIATSGGSLAYQNTAPTGALADKMVDERLAAPLSADANDFVWQWQSSRGYNPAPDLARIKAPVLVINAADDERNPPETGTLEAAMKTVKNGKVFLIPASKDTRGHGTTGNAAFYSKELGAFMAELSPHVQ
jgi:homoserine O-acetyltransferase